jgi:hypothetical protein
VNPGVTLKVPISEALSENRKGALSTMLKVTLKEPLSVHVDRDSERAFIQAPFIQVLFRQFRFALKGARIVANLVTLLG